MDTNIDCSAHSSNVKLVRIRRARNCIRTIIKSIGNIIKISALTSCYGIKLKNLYPKQNWLDCHLCAKIGGAFEITTGMLRKQYVKNDRRPIFVLIKKKMSDPPLPLYRVFSYGLDSNKQYCWRMIVIRFIYTRRYTTA